MKKKYKSYVYIDKNGIESLFNQLQNTNRTTKITTSSNLEGNIKSELDLGIAKILSGKINTEIDSTNLISKEYVQEVTIEDKIEILIAAMTSNFSFESLSEIIDKMKDKTNSLINCESFFTLTQAYDEKEKAFVTQSDIAEDPFNYEELSFEFNTTLKTSDGFCNIDMYLSGSNLVRRVRHLTHLLQYNKRFYLSVFGELTYCNKGKYYLKPFAIWNMRGF